MGRDRAHPSTLNPFHRRKLVVSEVESIRGRSFSECRDHLKFDCDRGGECGDFNRGARRIWFAGPGKMFRVEAIINREVFLHVREEDRNIDNVVPTRVSVLQHKPHVFEHGAALRFDVVGEDVADGIERHARDLFAAAHAWPDPGEEKQIADPLRVRERAHRFRRARAFEGFAHLMLISSCNTAGCIARLDRFGNRLQNGNTGSRIDLSLKREARLLEHSFVFRKGSLLSPEQRKHVDVEHL